MHGDHMPMGTDVNNAVEVCRRAAKKADTLYGPPICSDAQRDARAPD